MAVAESGVLERSTALRLELKQWEKDFTASNEGRKAGRADIKNNAEIASKYKEYDRLRALLSIAAEHSTPSKAARKPSALTVVTPTKRLTKQEVQQYNSPTTVRKLFTSCHTQTVLGPTPRKDGQVLGIFDLLLPDTPATAVRSRTVLRDIVFNVLATPSKVQSLSGVDELPTEGTGRGSRTPTSAGKRYLLDTFATPIKRKREDDDGTPSSAMTQFATPTFLRRTSTVEAEVELGDDKSVIAPPLKKRSLVRSLSSMIQGLRKQEDDRLDEEMQIMRELLPEEDGTASNLDSTSLPNVLVEDIQMAMPLGPDRGDESDETGEEIPPDALDSNGLPRKVWKKKGQKRTTKKVTMRPVRSMPKAQMEALAPDTANNEEATLQRKGALTAGHKDDGKAGEPTDSAVKKVMRKISAHAHANFRRLKIKKKKLVGKGKRTFS
ncbi:DNA replication regulator SLD2 [Cryomyces antarcticus]